MQDGLNEAFRLAAMATNLSLNSRQSQQPVIYGVPGDLVRTVHLDSKLWFAARTALRGCCHLFLRRPGPLIYTLLLKVASQSAESLQSGRRAFGLLLERFGEMPEIERNDLLTANSAQNAVLLTHFLAAALLVFSTSFTDDVDLRSCPLGAIPLWIKQLCSKIALVHDTALVPLVEWPLRLATVPSAPEKNTWISVFDFLSYIRHDAALLNVEVEARDIITDSQDACTS
jgi:hypothetical protein